MRSQSQDSIPDYAKTCQKEWTTRPEFMTPLVDHCPKPPATEPEDVLGYYVGSAREEADARRRSACAISSAAAAFEARQDLPAGKTQTKAASRLSGRERHDEETIEIRHI